MERYRPAEDGGPYRTSIRIANVPYASLYILGPSYVFDVHRERASLQKQTPSPASAAAKSSRDSPFRCRHGLSRAHFAQVKATLACIFRS